MITTGIIAFREFLEAFLITGVFLGVSRKLRLGREREIALAATIGMVISLLLPIAVYLFGDYSRGILTEKRADALESYLMMFSGFFIAYVVFSLHRFFHRSRGANILSAHEQLARNAFDMSLFLTIVFLVIREGFEIALFTASVSLFSTFIQNLGGLILGFAAAGAVGCATYLTYVRLPVGRIFRWTEYLIVLVGASLVQTGLTEFLETHTGIRLSGMLPFPVGFLPHEDSAVGHFLKSTTGIDREFSAARLLLMLLYVGAVYALFLRRRTHAAPPLPSIKL